MSGLAQLDAWQAALSAAVTPWQAFRYDEIQALVDQGNPLPPMYVLLTVTRRAAEPIRMCGARPVLGWRLQTLTVGTAVGEVEWLRDRVRTLMDTTLPGIESTPLRPDGESDTPEEHEGVWQALDSWTYAAPND